jgi:CheY-like chemotaxis protein
MDEKPLRVLVADDRKQTREYMWDIICKKLRREGLRSEEFQVVAVSSRQRALEALSRSRFDIAVVDLHLQGDAVEDPCEADGYRLLREIAESPDWSDAYRILYTAQYLRGEVPAQTETGVRVYHAYIWIHETAPSPDKQVWKKMDSAPRLAALVRAKCASRLVESP